MQLLDIKYAPVFGEVTTLVVVFVPTFIWLFWEMYKSRKRDKEFDEWLKKQNQKKQNAEKNIY